MDELFGGFAGKQRGLPLDPRTKLLMLAVTGVCTFANNNLLIKIAFAFIPALLLLGMGRVRRCLRFALLFAVLLCAQLWLVQLLPATASGIVYMFAVYLRKLLPSVTLGSCLIASTHVSEFLAAVSRFGLPKEFTIALTITLRYFPTMGEEWRSIRSAMAMRGIGGGVAGFVRHPMATMEYVCVPMLVSASKISDEITQAAITRDIESEDAHSCVTPVRFGVRDVVMLLLYATLVVLVIVAKGSAA